jgi:DNA polymerase elongation subunit (family B)
VRKKKLDGDYARQPPHVEMARVLEARGRDVSEGTKIEYVIIDGTTKPATIIPGEDWDGTVDTYAIWDSQVAAPTIRLLAAAFPDHDWSKWKRIRPPTPRKPRKKKDKPAGQTTEAGDME